MFDHVRLSVRDIGRSERFYDPVMRCLGYARRPRDDDGVAWGAPAARGQIQWFILTPAAPELRDRPHRHLAPGLHHVAFAARSRALVDDAYAVLLGQSAQIIEPPGPYDDDPDCYAVFFRDPDGTKLEVLARGATTGAP